MMVENKRSHITEGAPSLFSSNVTSSFLSPFFIISSQKEALQLSDTSRRSVTSHLIWRADSLFIPSPLWPLFLLLLVPGLFFLSAPLHLSSSLPSLYLVLYVRVFFLSLSSFIERSLCSPQSSSEEISQKCTL